MRALKYLFEKNEMNSEYRYVLHKSNLIKGSSGAAHRNRSRDHRPSFHPQVNPHSMHSQRPAFSSRDFNARSQNDWLRIPERNPHHAQRTSSPKTSSDPRVRPFEEPEYAKRPNHRFTRSSDFHGPENPESHGFHGFAVDPGSWGHASGTHMINEDHHRGGPPMDPHSYDAKYYGVANELDPRIFHARAPPPFTGDTWANRGGDYGRSPAQIDYFEGEPPRPPPRLHERFSGGRSRSVGPNHRPFNVHHQYGEAHGNIGDPRVRPSSPVVRHQAAPRGQVHPGMESLPVDPRLRMVSHGPPDQIDGSAGRALLPGTFHASWSGPRQ